MDKLEINICRASYRDMHEITKIISSSAKWYEEFVEEKDMPEHTPDRKWIEENFERRDFYICRDNLGKNIGTISMQHFEEGLTYLGYIYLDVKHVGKGIGQRLIQFAEKISKIKGQEALILIAHPEAKWATRAYEKFGFKKKYEKKSRILDFKNGLLEPYYEEGFHLYEYNLGA